VYYYDPGGRIAIGHRCVALLYGNALFNSIIGNDGTQ